MNIIFASQLLLATLFFQILLFQGHCRLFSWLFLLQRLATGLVVEFSVAFTCFEFVRILCRFLELALLGELGVLLKDILVGLALLEPWVFVLAKFSALLFLISWFELFSRWFLRAVEATVINFSKIYAKSKTKYLSQRVVSVWCLLQLECLSCL